MLVLAKISFVQWKSVTLNALAGQTFDVGYFSNFIAVTSFSL